MLAALVYMLFIDPALTGRAELRSKLPELRQQAAELQAMALEAQRAGARSRRRRSTPMTQRIADGQPGRARHHAGVARP